MFSWKLNQQSVYLLAILLPLLFQAVGLGFAVTVDSYLEKKQKRIYVLILALVLALIAQNYLEMVLSRGEARILLRTLTSILGYVLRPVILVLFFYLVEPKRSFWPAWLPVIVNAVFYSSALFSDLTFRISEDNHYQGGPLGNTCLLVSLLMMFWLFRLIVSKYRENRGRDIWILIPIAPTLIGSIVLDGHVGRAEQPVSFLTVAIVSCCMLCYLWLHLQHVHAHERDLRAQQRMQIMLSQIKPHFLYNALGAIEALCDTDPKAAKTATVHFSKYLRSNLNAISQEGPVPFDEELSHTHMYLELEKLRFEDALQVVYDLTCTDFTVPVLTLEPLAENAVRHGVRGNPDGRGTVKISTRELPDCYEVSVQDDGPGFDPTVLPTDGRPHIGIQNVRERLQKVCGGELIIRSAPERGSIATIRLPKEGV